MKTPNSTLSKIQNKFDLKKLNKNVILSTLKKMPGAICKTLVFKPLGAIKENIIDKHARRRICKGIASVVFKLSKESPSLIIIITNSLSIISSHLAQIGGLKKSNRENKDYLIDQECAEFGLDILISIIPPILLNNYMMKKLTSGQWTTKRARNELLNTIAPTLGVTQGEVYNSDNIKTIRQSLKTMGRDVLFSLRDSEKPTKIIKKEKLNKVLDKLINFFEMKRVDKNKLPVMHLENLTTDFDCMKDGKYYRYYNSNAYDEINGMFHGITLLSTIGYTIIASNIIMPILKNKLSNYSYQKQLEKNGETKESVKRKRRFNFAQYPPEENTSTRIFDEFIYDKSSEPDLPKQLETNIMYKKRNQKEIFNTFETYNKSSQSNRLRI